MEKQDLKMDKEIESLKNRFEKQDLTSQLHSQASMTSMSKEVEVIKDCLKKVESEKSFEKIQFGTVEDNASGEHRDHFVHVHFNQHYEGKPPRVIVG